MLDKGRVESVQGVGGRGPGRIMGLVDPSSNSSDQCRGTASSFQREGITQGMAHHRLRRGSKGMAKDRTRGMRPRRADCAKNADEDELGRGS